MDVHSVQTVKTHHHTPACQSLSVIPSSARIVFSLCLKVNYFTKNHTQKSKLVGSFSPLIFWVSMSQFCTLQYSRSYASSQVYVLSL